MAYPSALPVAYDRHLLVDPTVQFWRYGREKCPASSLGSEVVQINDAPTRTVGHKHFDRMNRCHREPQYWDFFAPQSPRFHQYLSVCDSIITYPEQGKISCQGQALFTILDADFATFNHLAAIEAAFIA